MNYLIKLLVFCFLFFVSTYVNAERPQVLKKPTMEQLREFKLDASDKMFRKFLSKYVEHGLITKQQEKELLSITKEEIEQKRAFAQQEEKRLLEKQEAVIIGEQAIDKIKKRAVNDSKLPLNVRKDKYMVALTNNLKQEKYYKAIAYFDLLNKLDVELSPSFTYFWGEALLKINKPEESLKKLYAYIEKVGSTGKYYSQALQLTNQAEDN